MLSLRDCKRYVKNSRYSDKEIEEIRHSCYQLAHILIDNYLEKEDIWGNKKVGIHERRSMVNEAESQERMEALVERTIDMFEAEIRADIREI